MEELLANGGRRRFKSFNGLYLTGGLKQPLAAIGAGYVWALPRNDAYLNQDWTIVQINNNEVINWGYFEIGPSFLRTRRAAFFYVRYIRPRF